MKRISPQLLVLSWVWIAACAAYVAFGYATYSGLYRWLAELQVSIFGKYAIVLTGVVPVLILAAPALTVLRRDYLARQTAVRESQATSTVRAQKTALLLIALSAPCFILSGVTFLIGQSKAVPAGNPVPVDLRTLETAGPPEGRVTLQGSVLVDRGVTTITESSWQTSENFYAPIVASAQAANSGGYRVFVKRSTVRSKNQPAMRQMFIGTETGVLIRGGLPAEARAILAQQGVRVADPHWVLSPPTATNDNYYAAAAAAGLIGVILLAGGAGAYVRARRSA